MSGRARRVVLAAAVVPLFACATRGDDALRSQNVSHEMRYPWGGCERAEVHEGDATQIKECEDACRHGSAAACTKVAAARACTSGSVLECTAACDGGNDLACKVRTEMWISGKRAPRDWPAALSRLETQCAGGDLDVCQTLATAYHLDRAPVVGADRAKAASYYARVCRERDILAGQEDGMHVMDSCWSLIGLSPADAVKLFGPACDAENLRACVLLVDRMYRGVVPPATLRIALERLCVDAGKGGWVSAYCGRLKDLGSVGALGADLPSP